MTQNGERETAWMRMALRLARGGEGRVEPNPMVGCVLVRRGQIVGVGRHRRFGGPHAEIEALRAAGDAARGADAFVTLEPCCYHGKTPPCTEALVRAGVRRVVAAVRDPNPRVRGRGLRRLAHAGIRTESGLCADEAAALIAPFEKLTRQGRPWVILKWAQSLDGVIATRDGDSRWISDEAARRNAHATRGRMDAVIVGVGTVLADDPLLTCRHVRPRRIATRVVFDTRLRTPPDAAVALGAKRVPTLICCGRSADARRARRLAQTGCEVVRLPSSGARVSASAAMEELGRRGMTNVLVEGGGQLLGTFLDEGLADEVHAYIAPRLIGGADAVHAMEGRGAAGVAICARLEPRAAFRRLGDGWLLAARLTPARRAATKPARADSD